VLPGNVANYILSNARTRTQASEVNLPHLATLAHVVHQVVRVAFAPYESHVRSPCPLLQPLNLADCAASIA
jgi:hypothetical protein